MLTTDERHTATIPAPPSRPRLRPDLSARTLLDGYPAAQLQKRFPNIANLIDWVRPVHGDDMSTRLAVANGLALQFGWRLFAPILRSATGLDELTDDEIREVVRTEVGRILNPANPD